MSPLILLENLGLLEIELYLAVILDSFRIPPSCRGFWVLQHQVDLASGKVVETNRLRLQSMTILLVISK